MDVLLALARRAFRHLHGLAEEGPFTSPPQDVRNLLDRARAHRVMGLLEAGLSISSRIAPDEGSRWRNAVFGQARHTSRCSEEAERLMALGSADMSALTLIKGPALARQAWPDPSLRSFDDLDFRCRAKDYAAACVWMQRAGYQPIPSDRRVHELLWRYGWGVAFRHPEGFEVEVNHRLFPPQVPWPRHLEPAGGSVSEWINLEQGPPLRSLDEAGHLVLSCAHAAWHGWERLGWFVDIAGLLARHPESLARAERRVKGTGFARRSLHAGCGLAAKLFGDELLPLPIPGIDDALLAGAVDHLARDGRSITMADQREAHRRLLGGAERWRYEWRRTATPGRLDFDAVRLHERIAGMYWVIRPLRIISRGLGAGGAR